MALQDARELLRGDRGKLSPGPGFNGDDLDRDEVAPSLARKPSTLSHKSFHLDGLDAYHGAGALIMMAGSVGMIVSSSLLQGPLWVGLLAGVLPIFLILAVVHPEHA